jgi:hypothetical protein
MKDASCMAILLKFSPLVYLIEPFVLDEGSLALTASIILCLFS